MKLINSEHRASLMYCDKAFPKRFWLLAIAPEVVTLGPAPMLLLLTPLYIAVLTGRWVD